MKIKVNHLKAIIQEEVHRACFSRINESIIDKQMFRRLIREAMLDENSLDLAFDRYDREDRRHDRNVDAIRARNQDTENAQKLRLQPTKKIVADVSRNIEGRINNIIVHNSAYDVIAEFNREALAGLDLQTIKNLLEKKRVSHIIDVVPGTGKEINVSINDWVV